MAARSISDMLSLAIERHAAGRWSEAEALGREILATHPDSVEALHLVSVIALQTRRYAVARDLARAAARRAPHHAMIHSNLGEACRRLGEWEEAAASLREALKIQPHYPDALNNLGLTLAALKRLDEAKTCLLNAIALKPDFAAAHLNLGRLLAETDTNDEALMHYERAVSLQPDFAEAWAALGNLLDQQGQFDRAHECLTRAVHLDPALASAHANLGNLCKDAGRLDEAVFHLRRAVELEPNSAAFQSALILTLQYHATADAVVAELGRWSERHERPLVGTVRPHENNRSPERLLRVGYVSADFRRHAVAFFLLPLLQAHDRKKVHLTGYTTDVRADEVTARLRACTDAWCDLTQFQDDEAAQRIREDRIDVLIDLSGHTAGNRLPVFARKPAPIQLSYLGYPGPTGLHSIDFFLSDPWADPLAAPNSEGIWRLPESAWCFAPILGQPEVSELPAKRNGHVTFGCFNNVAKITDEMIHRWSQILDRVPQSRIVFKNLSIGGLGVVPRLQTAFARYGIATERVGFIRPPASHLDHLASYRHVDIALDTFPYHGTTTTCEALSMGVPVVTLAGGRHLSRVGVSLLTNAGLPQFVAPDVASYVNLAAEAAGNFSRLADLRTNLRASMERSALMDAPRLARHLESAYCALWQRWCAQPSGRTP